MTQRVFTDEKRVCLSCGRESMVSVVTSLIYADAVWWEEWRCPLCKMAHAREVQKPPAQEKTPKRKGPSFLRRFRAGYRDGKAR